MATTPTSPMTRLGQGSIFRFGDAAEAEFAWRIPKGDEFLVFCSCPDFRLDDACEHIDVLMDLED